MILAPDGKPVKQELVSRSGKCPNCGASEKDVEKITPGFGGYFKSVCTKCGYTLASGRKE